MYTAEVLDQDKYLIAMKKLILVIQDLSLARDLQQIINIVHRAARDLTGADGATFVLREGNIVYYVDENAIAPLWKGKRFPINNCISGWAMLNKQSVVIEDVFSDPRIPHSVYHPTFVRSLAMVPVRKEDPIASIGNYWASSHVATSDELEILQALADSTSIALENVKLASRTQKSLRETQSANDEIARQLDLRDEFVSIAAHELQTPLTSLTVQMQFFSMLMKNDEFKDHPRIHELKKFIDISNRQVLELRERTQNLLEASRMRLGYFKLNLSRDVSLSEIIHKAVERCIYHDSHIKINIPEDVKGYWDKNRLIEAVRSILFNAIRFGQDKPIVISVSVENQLVSIAIKDEGVGIAKEDQARIFDRFERATSFRSYSGIGLGLFIVREIMKAHGGEIFLQSELGYGATFTLKFPQNAK